MQCGNIRRKALDQIWSLNSFHNAHLKQSVPLDLCTCVSIQVLWWISLLCVSLWPSSGSSRCRKATLFTSTGRSMPTGMKESIMGELAFSPQLMWRWTSSFYLSAVLCCTVVTLFHISLFCPSQILPPTEKPTPIKSPTLQVLDYGEAVALFNFNADLPVELSFRKVSTAVELQQRGIGFPSTLSPFNRSYWDMWTCSTSQAKNLISNWHFRHSFRARWEDWYHSHDRILNRKLPAAG